MKNIDIRKELEGNQTVLLLMPGIEYNAATVDIMKKLSGKSVCYVSLNKTFDSLMELFKKNKIDTENVVVVDAISKTVKQTPDQTDKCYFVSSPGALTELSIVINKFIHHEFEYLIFDSITTLDVYENKDSIIRFLSSIINKVKGSQTKAVFYALDSDHNEIVKKSQMFVDETVEL